jgi:hypothetical protein
MRQRPCRFATAAAQRSGGGKRRALCHKVYALQLAVRKGMDVPESAHHANAGFVGGIEILKTRNTRRPFLQSGIAATVRCNLPSTIRPFAMFGWPLLSQIAPQGDGSRDLANTTPPSTEYLRTIVNILTSMLVKLDDDGRSARSLPCALIEAAQ